MEISIEFKMVVSLSKILQELSDENDAGISVDIKMLFSISGPSWEVLEGLFPSK